LTFDPKDILVQELQAIEKSNKRSLDEDAYKVHDDPSGNAVIYQTNPLALVPNGHPIDLKNMIVKIADFGKGISVRKMLRSSLISSKSD
jgi:hypothetical protein